MPRRKCIRRVGNSPTCQLFKPSGVPVQELDLVVLELDELESIRLADLEGLYQEEAAKRMDVSRQTFGRIVTAARKKIARALIDGKALKIEGGAVMISTERKFACFNCQHTWELPAGTGRPELCPDCDSADIGRDGRGGGRRGDGSGGGRGSGCGLGRGNAGGAGRGGKGGGQGGGRGPGQSNNQ